MVNEVVTQDASSASAVFDEPRPARYPWGMIATDRPSDQLGAALAWTRENPLAALQRCGLDPATGKRSGPHLKFLCIVHDETDPSLHVTLEGPKAGLVKCFGCDLKGDLFTLWRAVRKLNGKVTRGEVVAFCRDMRQEVVEAEERVFKLVDADGKVIVEHHRIGDGPGKKLWWTRDGTKGLKGLKTPNLPLYRLPDLLKTASNERVFVTEGEPACDALREHGFVAVGSACGAKVCPVSDVLHHLKRFGEVWLWADADDEGRNHMAQIAERVGPNAIVVEWPDAVKGGDAVDFFRAGHLAEDVTSVLRPVKVQEPPVPDAPRRVWRADELRRATFPPVRWAVPNIIPHGLTILAARAKAGKSWLCLQLAFAKGAGGRTLGEDVDAGPVLYLALEDGPRRLKQRMEAQGWPDLPNVTFVTEAGPDDLVALLDRHQPELMVIDTFTAFYTGQELDQDKVGPVSDRLRELHHLARDRDLSLWVVDHHRKSATGQSITDIAGSLGKGAVADTILSMYREGQSRDAKLQIDGRDVEALELKVRWDSRFSCWQPVADDGTQLTHAAAILTALGRANGLGVGDLEKALGINRGSVHRTLAKLIGTGKVSESRGLYYLVKSAT